MTAAASQTATPRLWLDGRNHPGAGGTGIATYARQLGDACGQLGLQPEWLLGDDPGRTPRRTHGPLQRARRLLDALPPSRRLGPPSIGQFGSAPMLVSRDLFRVAQVHFDIYRRPLTLRTADPPALMHWTCPLPLWLPGVPNIVTIHDLIPLMQPELTSIPGNRMRRLLMHLVRRATRIVTVSETVRAQIIGQLAVPPDRVVNLFQAVDVHPAPGSPADDAPRICPPGSFVVFGTVEPRKNIGRLIAAHAASGVAAPLAIIGPDGVGAGTELAGIASHPGGPGAVLRVPWCPRPSLFRAISEARAVLFPSLGEGFGLPIAEAMALGTPVMTSRGGATGEIAAGAALLVDPRDIRDMAQAIAMLDSDETLRQRLRSAGRIRARLFSQAAYLGRLEAFYGGLLAGEGPGAPFLEAARGEAFGVR